MPTTDFEQIFGEVANCTSLLQVKDIVKANPGSLDIRRRAAAFGMTLAASKAVKAEAFFENTRLVLDELARAKAEIDIAAWHDIAIAEVTSVILRVAQQYVSETTIPCTAWPTPNEVVAIIFQEACKCALV